MSNELHPLVQLIAFPQSVEEAKQNNGDFYTIPESDLKYYQGGSELSRAGDALRKLAQVNTQNALVKGIQLRLPEMLVHGKTSQDFGMDYDVRYENWRLYCSERKSIRQQLIDEWHNVNIQINQLKQLSQFYKSCADLMRHVPVLPQPAKEQLTGTIPDIKEFE